MANKNNRITIESVLRSHDFDPVKVEKFLSEAIDDARLIQPVKNELLTKSERVSLECDLTRMETLLVVLRGELWKSSFDLD